MLVGSSTFGICGGGPLCTTEYGCDSCNIHEGYQWGRVEFEDSTFANPPLVMSQLQTAYGSRWVTLRHRDVTRTGFSVRVVGDGAIDGHVTEQIGYMALAHGFGDLHGLNYEATIHRDLVRIPGSPAHSFLCRFCIDEQCCGVLWCAVLCCDVRVRARVFARLLGTQYGGNCRSTVGTTCFLRRSKELLTAPLVSCGIRI